MELVRETERDLGNFGAVEVKKPSKRKEKEFLLSLKNLTFYKEKKKKKQTKKRVILMIVNLCICLKKTAKIFLS